MPVNVIKNMSDFQKDLLVSTVYVLDKHGLDLRNAFNVVTVLSQCYCINDLESMIVEVAENMDGLQDPSASRLVSPDGIRTNERGQNPYYVRMPGLNFQASAKAAVRQVMAARMTEEQEVAELQYKEPKSGAPREDLKKRTIHEDDPDIEGDKDTHAGFTRVREQPCREYMRYFTPTAAVSGKVVFHDRYDSDGVGVKQAGVVQVEFGKPLSDEAKLAAASGIVAKVLKADVARYPNSVLKVNYWTLPHKIAAISESFNGVVAEPFEYAVNYAIV